MLKRSSIRRIKTNTAPLDHIIAEETINKTEEPQDGESNKNPAAVMLGRLGGLKGGPARANKLTAEQRKEIALKAADARWHKK